MLYYYAMLHVSLYEYYIIKFTCLMLDIPLCFRIIKGVGTVNTTLFVLFIAINTTHIAQLYL